MRLINVDTLELREFVSDIPPYATLSHRWVAEELSYQAFQNPERRNGAGFEKISSFCALIRNSDGLRHSSPSGEQIEWAWVDTCCIDKTSSADLSGSINSMFDWYWNATYCIAYLPDVQDSGTRQDTLAAVRNSEWLKRGWTLQELLAPEVVYFYSKEWQPIGEKWQTSDLAEAISMATTIDQTFLSDRGRRKIFETCVAQRMTWASQRTTSRGEDLAYSLMGLFQVNMPLLYGEGSNKAFLRLQEEIIRTSDDDSIFAWADPDHTSDDSGILARAPSDFAGCDNVRHVHRVSRIPYAITNQGLDLESPAVELKPVRAGRGHLRRYVVKLNCARRMELESPVEEGSRSDGSIYQGCILGLEECIDGFVRSIGLEHDLLQIVTLEAAKGLQAGQWRQVESMRFRVALSDDDASRRRSRHRLRLKTSLSGIELQDGDGPYFQGLKCVQDADLPFEVDV